MSTRGILIIALLLAIATVPDDERLKEGLNRYISSQKSNKGFIGYLVSELAKRSKQLKI